ncbi:WD40 repeat domain-containing protein [Calothrix sp. UHCC 0171]|uniref:WD40 repeat domain-containing protein n=1 Tax=Calothrix sp. UHCC 0171 TaxID=3110245 RepID=UPI002B1FED89|nr:WD40 repeat domain-containing protein [Calothrix sp. UHCC 0171]MEA5573261.1 WD40 repeat domain-containing protein [Calothrix sp. UHCC 0171]
MNYKQLFNKTTAFLGIVATLTYVQVSPSLSQTKKPSLTLPTNAPIAKNVDKNRPLYSLRRHIWDVSDLAFSRNGKFLVSASFDETIQLWNLLTQKVVRSFPGHKEGVQAVLITPDAQTLISAGGTAKPNSDKAIRITSMKNGQIIRNLNSHSLGITALAITPDGQTLVSSSYDQTIKLWHWQTGKLINTLTGHGSWVRSLAISPDGKILVSGGGSPDEKSDNSLKMWDLQTGKLIRNLPGNSSYISFVGLTADGKKIISGSETEIKIWNANNGELTNTIKSPSPEGIKAIAISPNSLTLATTSLDASVKLWNLADGKLLQTLVPAANNHNLDRLYPSSVRFSPDGEKIAIGHGGGAYLSQFPIDVLQVR